MYALNFYSPMVADQLRSGRKTATIRLGELPAETAHEVDEVRWLPLEDGPSLLAYGGEREMAAKAVEAVRRL